MGEELRKGLDPMPREFLEDVDWAYEHYSEWMREYPDMWAAIVGKRIVATSDDYETAHRIAQEKTGRAHIPVIFIERRMNVY